MADRIRETASFTRSGCWEVFEGLKKRSRALPGISWPIEHPSKPLKII